MKGSGSILIVDLDTELANIIGPLLWTQGYNVHYAHNVKSALGKLDNQKYSYILLDPDLGDDNGNELFKFLNDEGALNRKTPFVLLTSNLNFEISAAFKPRIIGVLPKPFNIEMLMGSIQKNKAA